MFKTKGKVLAKQSNLFFTLNFENMMLPNCCSMCHSKIIDYG